MNSKTLHIQSQSADCMELSDESLAQVFAGCGGDTIVINLPCLDNFYGNCGHHRSGCGHDNSNWNWNWNWNDACNSYNNGWH